MSTPTVASAQEPASRSLTVALVGSPNSGKTTIFNALTGLSQKVANYPGVTVEEKAGWLEGGGRRMRVLDLPGLYGFSEMSPDEQVARDILSGTYDHEPRPQALLFVLDGSALRRSLALLSSVMAQGLPSAVAVTMFDEIAARGGRLDCEKLSRSLGVPVFPIVGHRGTGLDSLAEAVLDSKTWKPAPPKGPVDAPGLRAAWADAALDAAYSGPKAGDAASRRVDAVVLHPVAGPLIFLAVMGLLFQSIFTWAGPLQDLLSSATAALGGKVESSMADTLARDLVVHGMIDGVGGVLVFLPQIMILFFLVHFLEAVGYMARAAFLADRLMGWVGLQGRSFVALLSCHACAIPGIMAARAIPSETDRLKTMLVAPFVTCSARIPVYTLLIAAFVPETKVLGLGLQGLVLAGLYLCGAAAAFFGAWFLSRTTLKGSLLPFYMELPPYRWPTMKNVFMAMWLRAKIFVTRAGMVILPLSLLLWVLLSFPRLPESPEWTPAQHQSRQLKHSAAGRLGVALEPVFAPAGFDWRINIGVVASLAAREVVVATLAQIYGIEAAEEDTSGLLDILRTARDPESGRPLMTMPTAFALMAFFVFALQCISTLAIMYRETNTWRWPALAFAYMSVLAYAAAVLTYQITSRLIA